MNLFKHAAVFTDIHFGLRNNSRQHNEDCSKFVDWFIKEAKARGCETCIFCGDWHHHRSIVNVSTLNYSVSNFRNLSENFDQVFIIAGNHDLYYREKREINSFPFAGQNSNVKIINDEIFTSGNVSIIPWLIGNEWKKMKAIKSKYVFGHFELPDFYLNTYVKMPNHNNLQSEHFEKPEYVFSGHFHRRQISNNIIYIGNPFAHNYSDAGDPNRGAMFLKWDGEPVFVNYEGPQYLKLNLTTLIEAPEKYLTPNTFCKVILDTQINYEEANFLKDTFAQQYKPREFKLIPVNKEIDTHVPVENEELVFKSVTEIIHEQIQAIESPVIDKKLLLDIYDNL